MSARILVVGDDRMCFEVDALTLDPRTTSRYDAYAFTDPRRDIERISCAEWNVRRNAQWDAQQRARP